MARLAGRATTTFLFLGTLSLAGNTGSIMNSCGPLEGPDAAGHAVKDREPAAIVSALRTVLNARPAARSCDFWQDLVSDLQGISIANRARIQRFGEALHFVKFPTHAERQACAQEALSSIQVANPNLPAEEWIRLLAEVEAAFAGEKS